MNPDFYLVCKGKEPKHLPDQFVHTDVEQLQLLADGNSRALEYFYNKYYTSLVFFSMNITKDRPQSEDIALECFIKLWQQRSQVENTAKMRGFLFTAARNASLDQLKHINVKTAAHRNIAMADVPDNTIESGLITAELLRQVYDEIKAMPDGYREIIELLFLEDLPASKAAERLNISMDNLRQRKTRALKYLKASLLKKGLDGLVISLLFFRI